VRIERILRSLQMEPSYTLMRGVARFPSIRRLVTGARGLLYSKQLNSYLAECDARVTESAFQGFNREAFLRELRADGVAFGLKLSTPAVNEILEFSRRNPCFADRVPGQGFMLSEKAQADVALRKPILLAQYYNTQRACPAISLLIRDPVLRWLAAKYLGSTPTFAGVNLWWTFPVDALAADRYQHAHMFHRDVDDFRFVKFFFYLTDVLPGDGAHVCVARSHRHPVRIRPGDRWSIRRYTDAEITSNVTRDAILEICGSAGTGFAEDTYCVHKALTPTKRPRLMLQLQFALFDYGVMHDLREAATLRMLSQ
jgi:hypothetical protein